MAPKRVTVTTGSFPEEVVYVRSADDVVNGGVMFNAGTVPASRPAIIWIHGWGTNFYSPTYVQIGRELSRRGYTAISANTRMHDVGNNIQTISGQQTRGGGYWGKASEEIDDVAAWIDFAADQGHTRVVLVGHSAGWAAVRAYAAARRDPRVVGVVLASGEVRGEPAAIDSGILSHARALVSVGQNEELLRLPNRSRPSYVSAATLVDIASAPPEMIDFFGVHTMEAGVTRVHCPLLAFFGTREPSTGTEADLALLRKSISQRPSGPRSVTTAMIRNADHMYTGEESQVADVIANWITASRV